MSESFRERAKLHLIDFGNIVKCFIGVNYLNVAFAFAQSGILAGLMTLFIIAFISTHCCQLIIDCKYKAINNILKSKVKLPLDSLDDNLTKPETINEDISKDNGGNDENKEDNTNRNANNDDIDKDFDETEQEESDEELLQLKASLCRSYVMTDVAQDGLGKVAAYSVTFALCMIQYGFCVSYFIFLGNTLQYIIHFFSSDGLIIKEQSPNISILTSEITEAFTFPSTSASTSFSNITLPVTLLTSQESLFTSTIIPENSTILQGFINGTLSSSMNISPSSMNISSTPTHTFPSQMVNLPLLVFIPFPFFFLLGLVKSLRQLAFVSSVGNFAMMSSATTTLLALLHKFEVCEGLALVKWKTLPIFYAQIVGAIEGIGLVLSLEASMEGNRHNFSKYLWLCISLVVTMLAVFGVLGYARYGNEVHQIILLSLNSDAILVTLVRILGYISVFCTFPMQIFPVIELLESFYVKNCVKKPKDGYELLTIGDGVKSRKESNYSSGDSLSFWKSFWIRFSIITSACAVGIFARDHFAYVAALNGSLGCCFIGFVMPCLLHLRLFWKNLSCLIIAKDILILVIFGVLGGFLGVSATLSSIV